MVPIFEEKPDGAVGYGLAEFEGRLLEICADHRTSGRALAFAFLVFDAGTPEIIKMLRDADYWKALDQISGRYFSVFSLVTHQPRSTHKVENRLMYAVGSAPDPGTRLQLILTSYFGLDTTLELPAVLFFQVDDGRVSGYCIASLHVNGIEAAFNEIRGLLRDVGDALAKSEAHRRTEPAELFGAIKGRLRRRAAVRFLKDGKKVLGELKDIAGLTGMLG